MLGVNDTNHNLMKNLLEIYEPKEWGILTGQDVLLIKKTLKLEEMTIRELRNMRDYTVMLFTIQMYREDGENAQTLGVMTGDKMSAITSVIDHMIIALGGEV